MKKSPTFIAPDGRLYTHRKYVNWEGVREVEGSGSVMPVASHVHTAERVIHPINKRIVHVIFCDFTIQD